MTESREWLILFEDSVGGKAWISLFEMALKAWAIWSSSTWPFGR